MFLEILVALALGTLCGIFSGLAPGIHVNLISALIVAYSGALLGIAGVEPIIAFIVALAITHSFLDVIPSIFLGAPEPETALSVLPGHRMLLEGKGEEAVKLTVIGAISGLLIAAALFRIMELLLSAMYATIEGFIAELLFVVSIYMVFSSEKPVITGIVFASAGMLGYITMNARLDNALFPLLTGFFGLSTLLLSVNEESIMPKQDEPGNTELPKKPVLSIMLGTIGGFLTGVLPGLGSSTAATVCSTVRKQSEARDFLIMAGAITTVNFFVSIAAISTIGKARNGAVASILELTQDPNILLMITISLMSAGFAVMIALALARKFSLMMSKVNYGLTIKAVIVILAAMAFVLSGLSGIAVLFTSTAVGIYCNKSGVQKNTMMACILVPVMVFLA